jgi:hypothetical protein
MIMNRNGGMVVDQGCWFEKMNRSITPQKMMKAIEIASHHHRALQMALDEGDGTIDAMPSQGHQKSRSDRAQT